ncbi:hypothetical protein K9K77_01055 [Candidatus Babeliales bacterium]|nr:hypothetical protein [Candidatus Babeliales bacterium]
MKRKYLLLFLGSILLGCGFDLFAELDSCSNLIDQEVECVDLGTWNEYEQSEWEEDEDEAFLDEVAEEVENNIHEKKDIRLLDKALIGARAMWYFCFVVPYQKVKTSYYKYIYPFLSSLQHNNDKGHNDDA